MTGFLAWALASLFCLGVSAIYAWIFDWWEAKRQRRYHRETTGRLLIWASQQKAKQEMRW